MLPWFAVYNHTNYSQCGPVYLADMRQLPTGTSKLFLEGKFTVKRDNKKFCRVSVNTLKHVNVSKISGGIIDITWRSCDARNKWCLTYDKNSMLAEAVYKMFGIDVDRDVDAEWTNQEVGPTRLKRDEEDLFKRSSRDLGSSLILMSMFKCWCALQDSI